MNRKALFICLVLFTRISNSENFLKLSCENVENYSTHLFKIYKTYKVVNILPNSYEFDYQIKYEDKEKVIAYFYQKKFEKIKKFTLTFNLVENVLYDEMHEGFEKENLTLKDKKIYKCKNIQR